ncbi:DUF4097 family beta strand repeat-containing protein [Marinicella meishanensis]|uniref:DUF4097 family beta strand repeat-containing protein n=1 Tax=Marinicella meishanensis TaxID=2873263 RepID=UPI001CBB3C78|nr:DUF4097 family beta strand repeat-containing protein [Marinicella sp. NBU2979]
MKSPQFQCLLTLLFTLLTTTSLAEVNQIEKYTWKKTTTAKVVRIDNPIGDIRLRFGGYADEFELIAMVQHIESVGHVQVAERVEGDTYFLGVERINKATGELIDLKQNDKARIDFTVFVPQGRTVYATTEHGLAEARKMRDPVVLSTQSGQVFLRDNKNTVQASTVSGEIIANLIDIESTEKQTFKTVSGLIDLWIGDHSKNDVTMATSGDIISDFSTQMKRDMSQEPNKHVTVKANGGGNPIEATSKRGQIALRVYPQ